MRWPSPDWRARLWDGGRRPRCCGRVVRNFGRVGSLVLTDARRGGRRPAANDHRATRGAPAASRGEGLQARIIGHKPLSAGSRCFATTYAAEVRSLCGSRLPATGFERQRWGEGSPGQNSRPRRGVEPLQLAVDVPRNGSLPIGLPAPGALGVSVAVGRLDLAPVVPSKQTTPVSCHETSLPASRM